MGEGWEDANRKIYEKKHLIYSSPTPEENIITPTLQQWNKFKEYIPASKSLENTLCKAWSSLNPALSMAGGLPASLGN
jgi:hypothetical protein